MSNTFLTAFIILCCLFMLVHSALANVNKYKLTNTTFDFNNISKC